LRRNNRRIPTSEEMQIEAELGIHRRWLDLPIEIRNMRTPESLIHTCASKAPWTTGREQDFAIEDRRPWHDGHEIIIVDRMAVRQIEREFLRREGQVFNTTFRDKSNGRYHIKRNWKEWTLY
jgi:hypothetical protein